MKKMQYPTKEPMLVIRTCIKAICCHNSPASKLLSVLLYWYDHSTEECQDGLFTIYRTQEQLVTDAVDELTTRTLHDTAAPMLQALGYLTVAEGPKGNYYTLNLDKINEALEAYKKGRALVSFLHASLSSELEKFLIEFDSDKLEKFLIELEKFPIELENLLILIRKNSNSKRGRKAGCQAPPRRKTESLETIETTRDYKETTSKGANAPRPASLFPSEEKTNNKGRKPAAATPSKEKKPTITLTPEQQAVFDQWAKMPWFKGGPPALQSNDPEHLTKLAAYNPTRETMLKVKNWATSSEVDTNGFFKGKAWTLYWLAKEYPKWLTTIQDEPEEPGANMYKKPEPETDKTKIVIWTKTPDYKGFCLENWWRYEYMTLEEAEKYNYRPNFFAPTVLRQMKQKLEDFKNGKIQKPDSSLAPVA